MSEDGVTDIYIKKVMPWVGVVVVLAVLAPAIAHWTGASNHTAAVVFLIVGVPGAAWMVALSGVLGRGYGRQRRG
jgi:hypothetical protein